MTRMPTVFTHNRDRLLEGQIVTYARQIVPFQGHDAWL
jgi:hypothetical protein